MTADRILNSHRGLIEAPAGCGKTYLITEVLKASKESKPILVLTHTHAGVAILRQRAKTRAVPSKSYSLSTIDSWARLLSSSFPSRSGYIPNDSEDSINYLHVLACANRLLDQDFMHKLLTANYSRILVDEYQDCSYLQHLMVLKASEHVPTCVFGDPMQTIFDFKNTEMPHWEQDVSKKFPLLGRLNIPWRWRNAKNEYFGQWLLKQRENLQDRGRVDLTHKYIFTHRFKLNGGKDDWRITCSSCRGPKRASSDRVLVIGDSINEILRQNLARRTKPMVTVEPVEMKDLMKFAKQCDSISDRRVEIILDFAKSVMTQVDKKGILKRLATLKKNRGRKPPNDVEFAALELDKEPTLECVNHLLVACKDQSNQNVHLFRPQLYYAVLRALSISISSGCSFFDAAEHQRDKLRWGGRLLPKHGIGSTLLVKGLETDHVVILNADKLDRKNLYVAMTRGSKSVTFCCKSDRLPKEGM